MPYLSQTFESYQRVKIDTYKVNDLSLKNLFYCNMEFTSILQFADRTSPSVFSAIVFYIFLQLIILFMESIHILV